MKIIAIIDYEKNGMKITRAIGLISPRETIYDLYKSIQKQQQDIKAEILTIRLDMKI